MLIIGIALIILVAAYFGLYLFITHPPFELWPLPPDFFYYLYKPICRGLALMVLGIGITLIIVHLAK